MDLLGVAEEITSDGRIIVIGTTTPNAGDIVFDTRQKRIGSVKRIFGPVDHPYVSVVPDNGNVLNNIVGKKVYFEGASRYGKNKRRN